MKETAYLCPITTQFEVHHLQGGVKQDLFHYHHGYELYIFLNGRVRYCVADEEYTLQPYDIILMNSWQIHRPIIESISSYERAYIYYTPQVLLPYEEEFSLLGCLNTRPLELRHRIPAKLTQEYGLIKVLERILDCQQNNQPDHRLRMKLLFLELLLDIGKLFYDHGVDLRLAPNETDLVDRMLDYIEINLVDNFSVTQMASDFGISMYQLCRTFKKRMHCTITEYVHQKRVASVKELLATNVSCTDACYAAGFSTYSNFHKVFKQSTGLSPKGYQELRVSDRDTCNKED